jgi:hypothetical protein
MPKEMSIIARRVRQPPEMPRLNCQANTVHFVTEAGQTATADQSFTPKQIYGSSNHGPGGGPAIRDGTKTV